MVFTGGFGFNFTDYKVSESCLLLNNMTSFLFTFIGKNIILLSAFLKKTEKTPPKELDVARKRFKEVKP